MSNGGRSAREAFLASIEATDPALYADLVALRSRDPQGFRKRIRTLSTKAGDPIDMLVPVDLTDGYPGRARDPGLGARDVENAPSTVAMPEPPPKAAPKAVPKAAPKAATPAEDAPAEPPPEDKPKKGRKKKE